MTYLLRDRPFNLKGGGGWLWFFCFVQKKNFRQNKSSSIYFFCRAKCNFLFQNLTLGDMTKTLNQIIFFFLHQNQNIFFSNIGNQNIFLEKKHNPPPPPPPLQVKWSFPYAIENRQHLDIIYQKKKKASPHFPSES